MRLGGFARGVAHVLQADRHVLGQPNFEILKSLAAQRHAEPVDRGDRHIGAFGNLGLSEEGDVFQVGQNEVGHPLFALGKGAVQRAQLRYDVDDSGHASAYTGL